MIIVLDDQPERFAGLSQFNDAVFVKTNETAKFFLGLASDNLITIDELWLDHDLGGDSTTMPTIQWLEVIAHNHPYHDFVGQVFVHSMNPGTARAMVKILERWHYNVIRSVPFLS